MFYKIFLSICGPNSRDFFSNGNPFPLLFQSELLTVYNSKSIKTFQWIEIHLHQMKQQPMLVRFFFLSNLKRTRILPGGLNSHLPVFRYILRICTCRLSFASNFILNGIVRCTRMNFTTVKLSNWSIHSNNREETSWIVYLYELSWTSFEPSKMTSTQQRLRKPIFPAIQHQLNISRKSTVNGYVIPTGKKKTRKKGECRKENVRMDLKR